jgi:hypothetical protein
VQSLTGGAARPVTPEGVAGLFVAPDSSTVGARDLDGQPKLFPLAGGPPRTFKFDLNLKTIGYATNGEFFVGQLLAGGVMQVSRLNVTTGVLTPVRQIAPRPGSLNSGGIGSVILTPDGRGYLYSYAVNEATLFLVSNLK